MHYVRQLLSFWELTAIGEATWMSIGVAVSTIFVYFVLVQFDTYGIDDNVLETIHYDFKGFSSNELHLLNRVSVADGPMSKAKIIHKGVCNILEANRLSLHDDAPHLRLSAPKSLRTSAEPSTFYQITDIFEYEDQSNLPLEEIQGCLASYAANPSYMESPGTRQEPTNLESLSRHEPSIADVPRKPPVKQKQMEKKEAQKVEAKKEVEKKTKEVEKSKPEKNTEKSDLKKDITTEKVEGSMIKAEVPEVHCMSIRDDGPQETVEKSVSKIAVEKEKEVKEEKTNVVEKKESPTQSPKEQFSAVQPSTLQVDNTLSSSARTQSVPSEASLQDTSQSLLSEASLQNTSQSTQEIL